MEKPLDDQPVTAMRYDEGEALATIHHHFPGSQVIAVHDDRSPQ